MVNECTIKWVSKVKISDMPKVLSSADAAKYLREIWPDSSIQHRESCYMILLNRGCRIIGFNKISEGGCSGTVVDPKLIFQAALLGNAQNIILAHNHPSGDLTPSHQDNELTKKIKQAGIFLEIPLLDHIIMTEDSYFSFADNGII